MLQVKVQKYYHQHILKVPPEEGSRCRCSLPQRRLAAHYPLHKDMLWAPYNMLYTVEINILVTSTLGILSIKLLLNQTVTVALPY